MTQRKQKKCAHCTTMLLESSYAPYCGHCLKYGTFLPGGTFVLEKRVEYPKGKKIVRKMQIIK